MSRLGSLATTSPLTAPTEVPSTRSGVIPRSRSARSMPTSTAPSNPPPPRTTAVRGAMPVSPRSDARGFAGEVGELRAGTTDGARLGPEAEQRDGAEQERDDGEHERPAGGTGEHERHQHEGHVDEAVGDAEHQVD